MSGFSQGKSSNTHGNCKCSSIKPEPFAYDDADDITPHPYIHAETTPHHDCHTTKLKKPCCCGGCAKGCKPHPCPKGCLPDDHFGDYDDHKLELPTPNPDPVIPDPVPVISENSCEDCEDSLKQSLEAFDEAKVKAGELEAEKQELKELVEVINDEKKDLKKKLQDQKAQSDKEQAELQATIDQLMALKNAKEEDLRLLQQELKDLRTEKAGLEQRVRDLQAKLDGG